ncbi:MAG TPA: D-alanyl-D-alanine carboxypeptidase family protein [Steroidobacteraceae bacterium]|nr:D-alanyl-D-alanine carboxypeptidase family protein [Steroidobacteraceae bacterium]
MKISALVLVVSTGLIFAACGRGHPTTAAPQQPKVAETPLPPLPPIPQPPHVPGTSHILIDAANGQVIAATNENERMEPASLTKIMTAYAVFDALRSGSLKMDDQVTISEYAWRVGGAATGGSTSFMPVHSHTTVQVLLEGMIVQSGNDASIALAERVAGSEAAFAQLMNSYASRLGMTATHFENSTGLPAPNHLTTAHDMAILSRALFRDFPQNYSLFSERRLTYNNIPQANRNGLLDRDPSVDGIKTGHTESAGFCLAASAKRNDMRLISVVMKTKSFKEREDASEALLNYGFNFFESKTFAQNDLKLGNVRVWKGAQNELKVATNGDVVVTVPRGRAIRVQAKVELPVSVVAPIAHATPIGKVSFTLEGKEIATQALYPAEDIAEAGFFGRMIDSIRMRFE